MATVDEIKIVVRAEVDAAMAKLNQLNTVTKKNTQSGTAFAKAVAGYTTGFGLAVQATQKIIGGIADLTKESISLAMGFETAKISWGVLLGDMEKGEQMFASIQTLAAKTPLSFESVESGARTLKQFGINTAEVIPTIKMLGDVSMGNAEKLKGLSVVYGQIMSTGRLMGQDLLQLINQGFNPLQVISEKTGESMSDLKKRMEQGKISAQEVAGAFKIATSEGGLFYGMMDKTAKSSAGLWSTALDNIKMEMAEFGENLLKVINPALKEFNDYMDWKGGKELVLDVINGITKGSDASKSALEYLTRELKIAEDEFNKAAKLSKSYKDPEVAFWNARWTLLNEQLAKVKELNDAFVKQEKAEQAAADAAKKRADSAAKAAAALAAAQAKAGDRKGEIIEANKREMEQLSAIQAQVHDIAETPGYSPLDEEAIAYFEEAKGYLEDYDVWLEKWKKEREEIAPEASDWDEYIAKLTEAAEKQDAMVQIATAVQEAWANALTELGAGLVDGSASFADFGNAAVDALAQVLKGFGAQLAAMAAIELIKLNFAGAAAAGAGSAAAYVAAGALSAVELADGGIVKSKPGGTLALIGEAGRDEAVVPLNKGGSGIGGTTINVYGNIWQTRELEALAISANRKMARAY